MTLFNTLRIAGFSMLMFACAGIAAAQGPFVGTTTTSNLEMGATVQTAVQLNISTGTSGATVAGSNSTGLFTLAFGNVNGLGLGTPTTGVTVAADTTGATYSTPINLTPVYSGFTTETADVTVAAGGSANDAMAREGDSATTMEARALATPVLAFSNAASGSNNERFVGFRVLRTDAAGAKTATLIYTVAVAL